MLVSVLVVTVNILLLTFIINKLHRPIDIARGHHVFI